MSVASSSSPVHRFERTPGAPRTGPAEPPSGLLEDLPDPATLGRAVRDASGRAIDMRLEFMNAAARQRQPGGSDPIGRLCSELWPDMLLNGSFAACLRALDSGQVEQGDVEWAEGASFEPAGYEYRAVRVEGDRLLWTMRDSTDRLRHARALAESEARFRAVFEAAAVGMALVAPTGETIMVNGALAELVGEAPVALRGRRFGELVAPGPSGFDLLAFVSGSEDEVHHEDCEIVRADGGRVPACLSTALVRDLDGRPVHVIAHVRDASAQQRAQAALAHAATHDPLTGLPNRALLLDRLDQALRRRARTGRTCALLWLDLDHFKVVNDTLGHAAGDELLREVSRRLRSVLRAADTVARLGGDEFVALCEDLDPASGGRDALALGRQISLALEAPFDVEDQAMAIEATLGIALAHGEPTAPGLLGDADAALYEAKRQGRGRVVLFDDRLGALARRRSRTEAGLRQALARAEFEPHFQPVVELATGRLVSVEALARWRRDGRVLEPGAFLDVAQETGLVVPISEAIAEAATSTVAGWRRQLRGTPLAELKCNLNVAPRHVTLPCFVDRMEQILRDAELPATALVLEITEEGLMLGEGPVTRPLERLRAQGARIALDDFGSGFSSFARLHHLPVDAIKVDRAFLQPPDRAGEHAALLRAFVDIGRAFGLKTVVEGVEDAGKLAAARSAGFALAQGYHFGVPLPADAFFERHLARAG